MDYFITVDRETKTVQVEATGLLNNTIRKAIHADAAAQLHATGYDKLLIDLTGTLFDPDEPIMGALDLAQHMKKIGIDPATKQAFVYVDAEIKRKFFEQLARTIGFNLKYFKTRTEAMAWLTET